MSSDIVEGVFGQLLIILQHQFAKSQLFAPLLHETRRKHAEDEAKQPHKSRPQDPDRPFKMGHGGTLDPLASGILIIGIGRGTKHLNEYLGCKKTYEVTIGFGTATDTYDITGQPSGKSDYHHIATELISRKLASFKGLVLQKPPVYSALRINGVKACEYVRNNQELPRELEAREVFIDECSLLEFTDNSLDPSKHTEHDLHEEICHAATMQAETGAHTGLKDGNLKLGFRKEEKVALADPSQLSHAPNTGLSSASFPITARFRLTVSSGFYVRSFAHDLGIACSSLGTMIALRRVRQANYSVEPDVQHKNTLKVISHNDVLAGEEHWAPKIAEQLVAWQDANPVKPIEHMNGRDPEARRRTDATRDNRPRQRFGSGWQGETRRERRQQHKDMERAKKKALEEQQST